jgi:hypothetical protein
MPIVKLSPTIAACLSTLDVIVTFEGAVRTSVDHAVEARLLAGG